MRIGPGLAPILLSLLLAHPGAGVIYTWEMDADEQQVNNCALPACDPDGSTNSAATGQATLVYDTQTDQISWDISWNGLEHLLSAIHIHGPATPDVSNGAHIFDVFAMAPDVIAAGVDRTTDSDQDSADFSDLVAATGTFSQDPVTLLEVLTEDRAYVNIHSCDGLDLAGDCIAGFPMGEIRANLSLVGYELGAGETVNPAHGKCSVAVNDQLRKALRVFGRGFEKCQRKTAGGDPDACEALDPKLPPLVAKSVKAYGKRCVGVDDDLVLHRPPFGAIPPSLASQLPFFAGLLLVQGGSELIGGTPILKDADPAASRCQLEGIKRMNRCIEAHAVEFRRCKKLGFAGGDAAKLPVGIASPFESVADLDACLGFDRKGRIARTCGEKLERGIEKRCEGVDPLLAFPDGGGDAAPHVARSARCLACLGLSGVDQLSVDCDLFDDGDELNGSCGAF